MKSFRAFHLFVALLIVLAFSVIFSYSQTGGLRREPGFELTGGLDSPFTADAAIAQYQAVYLNSSGHVQPAATSGQTTTLVGVAPFACTSGQTNCLIQTWGIATAIADSAIAINNPVGAPSTTAGSLAPASSTLAVASGATSVTSSAANGGIVTGTPVTTVYLGRALTAQATAGSTFTVFIGLR